MKIIKGKLSGFCFGVSNTVERAYKELINSNQNVYCLGEIVHNERVISDLKNNGMIFVDDLNLIPDNSRVIFRAHGESKEIFMKAHEKQLDIIDLTCPKVKLIHQKILSYNNYYIVLIGKKNHPETIASISYSVDGMIVENDNDLDKLKINLESNKSKGIYILSQTTFSNELFYNLVNKIKLLFNDYDILIDKTICNTTSNRQQEVFNLSKKVTKMIIIGGKNSSNTKELYNVSKNNCKNSYLIQSKDDLKNIEFENDDIVGISAGASTPNIVIDEIEDYLNNVYKKTLGI